MSGIAGTVIHGGIDRSQDPVRDWISGPGMETDSMAGGALAHEVCPNS